MTLANRNLCTLPREIRTAISQGKFSNASSQCRGFLQATVNILSSEFVNDFHTFCRHNSSTCPILYYSKVGEVDFRRLIQKSKFRTDISATDCHVLNNGTFIEEFIKLSSHKWKDMTTFYLSHWTTYDYLLLREVIPLRHIEQGKNVPAYITNIPCYPVGRFSCPMVVTMRPIPRDLLEKVVEIKSGLSSAHGAPVHIGDPSLIGIHDLSKPDFGDWVEIEQGDIPLFWGSSLTITNMLTTWTAEHDLAFTHAEDCTFLTDLTLDQFYEQCACQYDATEIRVVPLHEKPQRLSIISQAALQRIRNIEKSIQEDPGGRGINNLIVENDLEKAVLSLSHSYSVALVTGFPCLFGFDPPFENDGVSGTVAVAKALLALNKHVTIIVDQSFVCLMRTIVNSCVKAGILPRDVPVIDLGYSNSQQLSSDRLYSFAGEFLFPKNFKGLPRFDHLLAIERAGPGTGGQYQTMRGIEIGALCDPIDALFDYALSNSYICTTGVGDGGNEVGMGKVLDKVKQHIPLGDTIACRTATKNLVTAGVSDWGGFGIAAGLYQASVCQVHERYFRKGIGLPRKIDKDEVVLSVEQAEELLGILGKNGLKCGISKSADYVVDGMPFWPVHADKLRQIRDPNEEQNM